MLKDLFLPEGASLSMASLLFNLGIGVILSLLLRWHYVRFGSTLSNREEFAQVFPFVLLTTVLIITVVKSSLALSLGLVGALSIVRFRTPIKEPEELAYLFIAIAMGLGLGASQTLPTVVAGVAILAIMAVLRWVRRDTEFRNLYLSVDWRAEDGNPEDHALKRLNEVISKHVLASDLRRFDVRDGVLEATYFLDISGVDTLSELTEALRRDFSRIGITFVDQSQIPTV
jgi:hypothetical protein